MSEKKKEPKKPYAYHQLRTTRRFPESSLEPDEYKNDVDYSLQAYYLPHDKRQQIEVILSKATDDIEELLK